MQYQPGRTPETADDTAYEAPRIVEAAAYLDQCRRDRRRFAVLMGDSHPAISLALCRFTEELPETARVARTPAPTDSSHAFLESTLAQFGFDPFDASADDLLRLLTVVLREDGERLGGSVIIIEDAHLFGPRVWETIRELARNAEEWDSSLLFVVTGGHALNRVLDSTGMASVAKLTRARFDLDDGMSAAHAPDERRENSRVNEGVLVLSRDNKPIGKISLNRDRMLIGRGEHSDVHLVSRFVSRQHALLLRNIDGDWLIDLKSTNGTIVNSKLIERRRLEAGDIISIGNFRLQYENEAGTRNAALVGTSDPDHLTKTVVMRSLKALHEPEARSTPRRPGKPGTSSAA